MHRLNLPYRSCYQRSSRKRWARVLFGAVIAFTAWQWGHAGMIHAKAWLAPILIERAWADSLAYDTPVKPWPWADTWPVAKLRITSLGIEQFVLAGTNGASLPFGPGHLTGSASPGDDGTIVLAGHRDTHFSFLPQLAPGTRVTLESVRGDYQSFEVTGQSIVDSRIEQLNIADHAAELVLVTCNPDALWSSRGPWRLVVRAARL